MKRALRRTLKKVRDTVTFKAFKPAKSTTEAEVWVQYFQGGSWARNADKPFEVLAKGFHGEGLDSGTNLITGVRDLVFAFEKPRSALGFFDHVCLMAEERKKLVRRYRMPLYDEKKPRDRRAAGTLTIVSQSPKVVMVEYRFVNRRQYMKVDEPFVPRARHRRRGVRHAGSHAWYRKG